MYGTCKYKIHNLGCWGFEEKTVVLQPEFVFSDFYGLYYLRRLKESITLLHGCESVFIDLLP